METKRAILPMRNVLERWALALGLAGVAFAQRPARITLDQAIQLAVQHNHSLQAARTMIQQNQAAEITANLRPNPTFFTDWEYLPLFSRPQGQTISEYIQSSTEGDLGLSYLIERGHKRQRRLEAAMATTAVTRATVADNERGIAFQVGSLFVNAQLAQSTFDLAQQDLKSFQQTVEIGSIQFKDGTMSENDYLKIRLQMVQFETDVQQAMLTKAQALSDLRQQLGYESVPAEYDVVGEFEYRPLVVTLEELQQKALQNRPDLRAAVLGVTAANSQYALAKANGKQDPTFSGNYSHVNGINGATDVKDAYEALQESARIAQLYRGSYLEVAQKSRDISEYAYRRGALALLDFLDAERSYRATQLAYRQAVAAYLTSLEQLRQAVGTRELL